MASENLALINLLKDKDVVGKDLMIKAYDINTGGEGWIPLEQLAMKMLEVVRELAIEEQVAKGKKKKFLKEVE